MDKVSINKIVLIALMAGTMIGMSTMISSANAAPTTIASGRGTGTFTCADGTDNPNLTLSFRVEKDKGKVSGQWNVLTEDFNQLAGPIYGGKIGKTSLTLLSILDFFQSPICSSDPVPTKGIITANCGQGTQVELKFENGAHGTFSTNVICF